MKSVKIRLPGHILPEVHSGMAVRNTSSRKVFTAYGPKAPDSDDQNWVTVAIDTEHRTRTMSVSMDLDWYAGTQLRDLLCKLYGPATGAKL